MARAGRLLGGALALLLTVSLAAGMLYAFGNLEQLKAQVDAWESGREGDSDTLALNRAADNAIGYAEDLAVPPTSDGSKGYRFSQPAPPSVAIASRSGCTRVAAVTGRPSQATSACGRGMP